LNKSHWFKSHSATQEKQESFWAAVFLMPQFKRKLTFCRQKIILIKSNATGNAEASL
jgi:hypothetical protein